MFEKMREIIAAQLNLDESTITMDSAFKEDLGADSLDLFELIMTLEEDYSIEIPTEDLADMTKVGDVVNYLKAHGIEN